MNWKGRNSNCHRERVLNVARWTRELTHCFRPNLGFLTLLSYFFNSSWWFGIAKGCWMRLFYGLCQSGQEQRGCSSPLSPPGYATDSLHCQHSTISTPDSSGILHAQNTWMSSLTLTRVALLRSLSVGNICNFPLRNDSYRCCLIFAWSKANLPGGIPFTELLQM
jgi:hypothetical protein